MVPLCLNLITWVFHVMLHHAQPNLISLLGTTVAALLVAPLAASAQSALTIPSTRTANPQGALSNGLVGISFEFFAFPEYFNVSAMPLTQQCLANLAAASAGTYPRIRIGGTTQDRATYDPTLTAAVSYTVASATDAPTTLTYGDAFIDLAASYAGDYVTLGLNRRLNQLVNTTAAAAYAVAKMKNLFAIELGNEPEFYGTSSPIAGGATWDPAADANSQTSWQKSVATSVGRSSLIQAGVRLQPQNGWSIAQIVPYVSANGTTALVTSFGEHSYPQSACGGAATNLTALMNHPTIVSYCTQYASESAAARSIGKHYYISETNSATCGGGGISPTFGAALWIVDYTMQLILNGAEAIFFHHGTIGNSPYSWWGQSTVFAPYYGAIFTATALANATSVQQLDSGATPYAAYAIYTSTSSSAAPARILLVNSDYYASGTRSSRTFSLSSLPTSVTAATGIRLTAAGANATVEAGSPPSISGLSFSNTDCKSAGQSAPESFAVTGGALTASVAASEALLLVLG
ncbi:hypothetical protein HK405_004834 [Cladochytrium tenue]|nr:hypothetical protein HK405_004834 [Cladochytrium tenue]